jgi:hypothetical protein
MEVWPTIATGMLPDEHGVSSDAEERTDASIKKLLIKINKQLPDPIQSKIVSYKQGVVGHRYPITEESHVFESGNVLNWPGITSCELMRETANLFVEIKDDEVDFDTFHSKTLGNTGQCIGWLAGQEAAGSSICGVHVHILDYFGHMYADQPEKLRSIYKKVDTFVAWLLNRVDHLVIISDHGMQTTVSNDPDPGVHSMHGIISTTEHDENLPQSVLDVRQWLESQMSRADRTSSTIEFAAPTDHLEELGYL